MNNSLILSFLNEFYIDYTTIGDVYRANAYLDAIRRVNGVNFVINKDNITSVGLGKKIGDKVMTYLRDGKCPELDKLRRSPLVMSAKIFSKIKGVGDKTIMQWNKLGVFTLQDLRLAIENKKIKLTSAQEYGLRYYTDLNTRIPRKEVESIYIYISAIIGGKTTLAGSYRRGAKTSGDVDMIVSINFSGTKYISTSTMMRSNIIDKLETDGILVGQLLNGTEKLSLLIYSEIGRRVRQVDIIFIPSDQYWETLLYFTGSGRFNEIMRHEAKVKGFKLSHIGLYKINNDGTKKRIKVSSEKEIFDIIGMKYVEPKNR